MLLKALTTNTYPRANAPAPGWQAQRSAKRDADIFDYEDQLPENLATARYLRMPNAKPGSRATQKTPSIPPHPGRATPLPRGTPSINVQQKQQDTSSPRLNLYEESLKTALAQTQLHIRLKHYANANGDRHWNSDAARVECFVIATYGKGALAWCKIAREMIEEERRSQRSTIEFQEKVVGDLKVEVERLNELLRRRSDEEGIDDLKERGYRDEEKVGAEEVNWDW